MNGFLLESWVIANFLKFPGLCILAYLNNAVVWLVSNHPFISTSFSHCTAPLMTLPSAPIALSITVTFVFHCCCFFSSLARSRYLSFFFLILSVLICSQPERQSQPFDWFSLFLLLTMSRFVRQAEIKIISLYLKIKENFVKLQDGFWVAHILLFRMIKFKILA